MLCDNQFCLATMTLYFSAVWTQSGESGNTLKIKCSGTADERANIFPCLQRRRRSEQQPKFGERHNALRLLNKPSPRWSVKRLPTTLAHSTAKEKDKRMVKPFTCEQGSKREVHIQLIGLPLCVNKERPSAVSLREAKR